MLSKILAAAVLGSALIAAPALAQNSTNQSASAASLWQGSKLINMNVYNDQNEKIGAIKELLVDKNGKIESVAIGVGGFLGMGERDVAVKFGDLKWSDQPVSSTSSSTTTTRPMTTGANTAPRADTTKHPYPDHAVFNATKDQLKAMPQFDYNK
jgi:PRC-barrel domain protein